MFKRTLAAALSLALITFLIITVTGAVVVSPSTVTVRKTSDETVNNSSTLQDDDALLLAMAANETWFFSVTIFFISSGVADFKVTLTSPTGSTLLHGCTQAQVNSAGGVQECNALASGVAFAYSGTGSNESLFLTGIVVNGGTAGNLQLQWAQNTAEVSDTKVLTNSYLEAHK